MGKINSQKHKKQSSFKEAINRQKQISVNDLYDDGSFLLSFKHLDRNQGGTFKSWEENKLLADCLEVLASYCNGTLTSQIDNNKFTVYGSFPKKSDFSHPAHVPEDAKWARIHIAGKPVIA